ncbi:hypothetical protein [Maritimibacter sp. DP1N21-5]|uniref:hypothetical protein n=1 Tax=Maritimibacter sp. DP1N21-5 TaxID=2836867 RepID=UPI001C48D62E|nr:hypothetical protein [Maritimibacter sp. DP1N21-5]MBV7407603.1 hypothetical protein [Maritimibacter sp. DP1N21-5]
MIKIISVFLIFMLVLAMFGRLRFPGQQKLQDAKCPKCGRFRLGKSPCPCGKS